MATRKKTKVKARGKRKKAPIRKAARKTRKIIKKRAKKASVRPVSPKKARPTAQTAGKGSVNEPLKRSGPHPTAQPVPVEQRIGVVTHYYGHLSVVALELEPGATLRVGDVIHILGHTTDFTQKVESLEVNHAPVTEVAPNDDFGLKVAEHAREHDVVFKVRS
jgi:hypothetical protein